MHTYILLDTRQGRFLCEKTNDNAQKPICSPGKNLARQLTFALSLMEYARMVLFRSRYICFVALAFSQTGCLTLAKDTSVSSPQEPRAEVVAHVGRTAKINFALESVNWSGSRTIFSQDQAEHLRGEFVDVLKDFGLREVKAPEQPDLEIDARLTIKDAGCKTVFISSNCWVTLIAEPLSLYILPTSFLTENEVSLSARRFALGKSIKPSSAVVRSVTMETYVHLLFAPLIPLELYRLLRADFRRELYRTMLQEQLQPLEAIKAVTPNS